MAAERQTILTSPNRRTAPLASVQTDPSGAFGDASGLVRLGQGVSAVGGAVQDVRQHAMQKRNQRDRRDFQDQVELAKSEYAKRQTVALAKARESNLRGEDLFGFVEKERQAAFQEFSGRLSAFRPRNPELYDELVGQDTMLAEVRPVDESVFQEAFRLDERLAREDRENTFSTLTDRRFLSGYDPTTNRVNTDAILAAALSSLEDLDEPGRFSQDFIRQKKSEIGNRAFDGLMAAASAGDPTSLKFAVEAAEKGLIGQVERRRIEGTYADAIKRDVPKEAMRGPFQQLLNLHEGGRPVDWSSPEAQRAVQDAVGSYGSADEAQRQVLEPLVQAHLPKPENNSAFNYDNMRSARLAYADPKSERVQREFAADWNTALFLASKATGLKIAFTPGAREFDAWYSRKKDFIDRFHDLVDKNRSYDAVAGHPLMRAADFERASLEQKLNILEDVYEQMGIPQDKRVLYVKELDAITRQIEPAFRDPSKIQGAVEQVLILRQDLGKRARRTFLSMASMNKPELAAVLAFAAQLDNAADDQTRQNITNNLSAMIQAQAWKMSQEGQKAIQADPALAKSVQTAFRAAFSTVASDTVNARLAQVAMGKFNTPLMGSYLAESPMYQALQNEGIAAPVLESLENFAQYLAFAHPKRMSSLEAARETMKLALSAFMPMQSNGANSDKPVWTLGRLRSREDDWYNPGRNPFSASNVAEMVHDDAAAVDALIVGPIPAESFALAGRIQWSLRAGFASFMSALRLGEYASLGDQAKNAGAKFLFPEAAIRQAGENTFSLVPDDDFTNLGVLGENNEFVSLVDYATKPPSYWPEWVKQAFANYTKRVNMSHPKAADTLARQIFADHRNLKLDGDVYRWELMPASRYQGLPGTTTPGIGPWATVMVRHKDGSIKPFTTKAEDLDRKIEQMKNLFPAFSMGMPKEDQELRDRLHSRTQARFGAVP